MRTFCVVLCAFLLATLGTLAAETALTQDKAAAAEPKMTADDAAKKNPVASTAEGLAEARKFYGYDCAMCHGKRGDGKGELVESMNLTINDWRDPATLTGKTDGELFYIITKGKGKMPAEGDRQTEKLRWNLVNLVRSFGVKGGAAKPSAGATR